MQRYRNQVLAGLLFISSVLIAVIAVTGVDELADQLQDFPLWLFIPVFLLKCVNWTLRYIEWRYFLGVIGIQTVRGEAAQSSAHPTIRERDSAVLWLAGLTLSISPGKLAEVLKALVVKSLTGVDFSRAAPVIFLERLVDGLAVIPLTTAALIAVSGSLDSVSTISPGRVAALLLGVTLALGTGIAAIQSRPLAQWLLDHMLRLPGLRRFERSTRNLYESSYELIQFRHLLPTVLLGLGAFFTDSLGFYLILCGLGMDGSWALLGEATFILGFSVIVASLSTLPGGAGGRELAIGTLLTGMVGLSSSDAGTATFLISVFQLWLGVLLGLIVIALFRQTLFPPSLQADIAAYQTAREVRQAGTR